jgi:hypothetical protein
VIIFGRPNKNKHYSIKERKMPKVQNICEDRCLSINVPALRAKWSPKDRPREGGIESDTVVLTDEQIELPEIQSFLARGFLKVQPDSFKPAAESAPPKRGATTPRSAIPRKRTMK